MRLWSSLLLVTFSGVLSAAPAAPAVIEAPPPAKEDPRQQEEKKKKPQPVVHTSVVLRDSDHQDRAKTSAGGGPEPTFVDTAPALRARRLGRVWRPQAPIDPSTAADLRAGLIATPPPAA